jgi:ubiquinone biosynthesis protein Coq4
MDIAVFSPEELPLVLETLITVAAKPKTLTPLEQQFLQVVNQLHQGDIAINNLSPIAPANIAVMITEPQRRQRLLEMAMVMAIVDGEIAPSQQKIMRSLAEILGFNEPMLRKLHKLASDRQQLARMDIMRQLPGKLMGAPKQKEGICGITNRVKQLLNNGEDLEVAWKYRQLGLLPQGTLGRAFWKYYTRRCFSFPGEAGGIPEHMTFHDFGHILSGYDTTPEGEIQQGAFQAGFSREAGFIFLLFAILHVHWGVKISTVGDADIGLIDMPLLMQALKRGEACKVDFSDNWNFWEVVDVPVEKLCDYYNILPLKK